MSIASQDFAQGPCPTGVVQPPSPLRPIDLGGVTIAVPVILAPMSGVTDLPFRRVARELGTGLVVSEMIASQAMVRENRQTLKMAEVDGFGGTGVGTDLASLRTLRRLDPGQPPEPLRQAGHFFGVGKGPVALAPAGQQDVHHG